LILFTTFVRRSLSKTKALIQKFTNKQEVTQKVLKMTKTKNQRRHNSSLQRLVEAHIKFKYFVKEKFFS